MNHENDICKIEFQNGTRIYKCSELQIDWPPPEELCFLGFSFELVAYSAITDEQIKTMHNVSRGALYQPSDE